MFTVPSDKSIVKITITKDCILDGTEPVIDRDLSKLESGNDKPAIAGV